MEKMIWELKNALCKTDPSHVFCKWCLCLILVGLMSGFLFLTE
jgi:hypothetical protein